MSSPPWRRIAYPISSSAGVAGGMMASRRSVKQRAPDLERGGIEGDGSHEEERLIGTEVAVVRVPDKPNNPTVRPTMTPLGLPVDPDVYIDVSKIVSGRLNFQIR